MIKHMRRPFLYVPWKLLFICLALVAGLFYASSIVKFYYGVKSKSDVKKLCKLVAEGLGGGDKAYSLILETACVETKCGTFPDAHPEKWGVGLCQHDQIGLDDIQLHVMAHHEYDVRRLFGYDIKLISLDELANDPLLSLICCRLSYKRVPAPIPDDLYGRALYWKEHYNTESGAGTVEHYIESVKECLGDDWA